MGKIEKKTVLQQLPISISIFLITLKYLRAYQSVNLEVEGCGEK
jgi:hypothetical protein